MARVGELYLFGENHSKPKPDLSLARFKDYGLERIAVEGFRQNILTFERIEIHEQTKEDPLNSWKAAHASLNQTHFTLQEIIRKLLEGDASAAQVGGFVTFALLLRRESK